VSTKIEWTDEVFNPVTGCTKVSAGCKNCYAERIFPRGHTGSFSEVLCHLERLDQPLHWRKPRRIFVCSMGDLFHPDVPEEFIDQVFAVMALCPQHTFQVLTKRPERMRVYFVNPADVRDRVSGAIIDARITPRNALFRGQPSPAGIAEGIRKGWRPIQFPNVWLGVSCENQEAADERIPLLLQTPAAVRFVSVEPMLGPISFRWAKWDNWRDVNGCRRRVVNEYDGMRMLDWIICGGESGPNARPINPDWARSLRDQCQAAVVPFFFKQWGEWREAKDGDLDLYPKREWDGINDGTIMVRVGKKTAGYLLDGVEYREFPGAFSDSAPEAREGGTR
jgi:protein gp37